MRRLALALGALAAASGPAFGQTAAKVRTLQDRDGNRAYWGAPPTIPHAVDPEVANRPQRCLACHQLSTYVPPLNAFSPATPHPELTSCTQCHVPGSDVPAFRPSQFVGRRPPALTGGALVTSPPPMPHPLQMRANCGACHAGPAAPAEIRTPHPERTACLQCHVPTEDEGAFRRASEAQP